MDSFKVGQTVVYPAQGIGIVNSIECREFSGNNQRFYILQLLDQGTKIMVPVDKVASVGLRTIVDKGQAEQVFKILKEKEGHFDKKTWNKRYKGYMEKIKSGSIFEIAAVLRDLNHLKTTKSLSFGEKKILETAKTHLVKEIAIAKSMDENLVEKKINAIFYC